MTRSWRYPAFIAVVVLVASVASAAPVHSRGRVLAGDAAGGEFGSAVAACGDVDGDGVDDTILGAPGAGLARVLSGADGSTIHEFTCTGTASDRFGASVSGGGDVDDDGIPDLIVGAPRECDPAGTDTGAVHVYSGATGDEIHVFRGQNSGEYFGYAVADAGDTDGDGCDDVLVGVPGGTDQWGQTSGLATVYSGATGEAYARFYGVNSGDEYGCSVAGIGDLDGDGCADVAVGARNGWDVNWWYMSGYVQILSPAAGYALTTLSGDYDYDAFGSSVAGVGDVDGDGCPDLAVGAPGAYNWNTYVRSGLVRVFSGSKISRLFEVWGEEESDLFGTAVSGAGDLDGDDLPDVIVGAPGMANEDGDVTGAVRAFTGGAGDVILTAFGLDEGDAFGTSVAPAGDVDDDGAADFVVGVPGDDGAGADAGEAVFFLSPNPSGRILIAGGAVATDTTSVTLGFTWTGGGSSVTHLRVRNAGEDWDSWRTVTSTLSWELAAGEGEKTVEVQFRDQDLLTSDAKADSIILDESSPCGSFTIAGDAEWVNTRTVQITLVCSDPVSSVTHVRFRNLGKVYGDWIPAADQVMWTLEDGTGMRTVEGQFRDAAGNLSEVASDTVGLDLEKPTGSVIVNGGASFTTDPNVSLELWGADTGGSGLTSMRVRLSGDAWSEWQPVASPLPFVLSAGDGRKDVQAQFRDGAGNESAVSTDSIRLDVLPPTVNHFYPAEARIYYLPDEPLLFTVLATDTGGGTGAYQISVSWDDGTTWSAWQDLPGTGVPLAVARPAQSGLLHPQARARDVAGNVSPASPAVAIYLLETSLPSLGGGGAFAGGISGASDVDAVSIELVAGDVLSAKIKAAALTKGPRLPIAVDLVRATGERVFTGRFPAGATAPGVTGFVVPETGRYYLVVRLSDDGGATQGTYSLAASVKQAKANAGGKAVVTTGEVVFSAADGASLKAALKGDGLDPASVVVTGPDGDVPVTVTGKPGSAKIAGNLGAGTGVYTIRFTATGPVSVSWSSKTAVMAGRVTE